MSYKKTILIVDDDEKNLKLMDMLLASAGYRVLTAKNGQEAVVNAKEQLPDLIIMDNRMPVMDGITAAKILKADAATKLIPIIAATASAMKGDRERIMLEAGCNGYVPKPIDVRSFALIIKKYLGDA